jgi:hypothetical protein
MMHSLFFDLPHTTQDPQIIAQAACEKIPVVTCDEKFGLYKKNSESSGNSLGLLSGDAIWTSVLP